jgi:membrane associated rhomboid family serine protease
VEERVLRVGTHAEAEAWALTLASSGVSCRLEEVDGRWAVVVASDDATRAGEALDAYDEENRPAPSAATVEYGATWLGPMVALGLLALFFVTGDRGDNRWFERGSADAAAMLHGEWWRAITALTLHADLAHVGANAAFAALLFNAVGRALGPGVGGWLLLAAGALGNALTAWVHGGGHVSVGASTSVFAAVGALAALAVGHRARPSRRAWVVIAASLALFGLLGTSKGADVLAHAFGLVAGGALGLVAARLPLVRSRIAQGFLAALALAAVFLAWRIALEGRFLVS